MYSFRSVIHGKEKQDAGEQIQPQRIHVTDALAGEELICESPWFQNEERDRREEFGIPIEELVQQISDNVPERTAILDSWLATLSAPMPLQLCATVLAVRDWRTRVFAAAQPSPARSSLECTYCRIAENNFCRFIGHTPAMLQNYLVRVDSAETHAATSLPQS